MAKKNNLNMLFDYISKFIFFCMLSRRFLFACLLCCRYNQNIKIKWSQLENVFGE